MHSKIWQVFKHCKFYYIQEWLIYTINYRDLSHTSIDTLPINGLKKLKTLILNDVPTLKSLPSVLSFTDLETAHFTYPHHCCLFKVSLDIMVLVISQLLSTWMMLQ